ncbi:MAG: hypothetical protein F6J95_031865 [Leptolyngbya sp. SIO1E4]|nr:hypothetical protein [Leptolyngbya sp. SIO1E4]
MAKRTYRLPPDRGRNPRQLSLSWHRNWTALRVYLDDRPLGSIPDLKALPQQQMSFRLQEGAVLDIKLTYSGVFPVDIMVLLDGVPVAQRGKGQSLIAAGSAIFLIAGGNLLAGLPPGVWDTLAGNPLVGWLSFGTGSVLLTIFPSESALLSHRAALIIGSLYLFLGIRVLQRSWVALTIAAGLFCLDAIGWLLYGARVPGEALTIFMAVFIGRFFILTLVGLGFEAFDESALVPSGPAFMYRLFRAAKTVTRLWLWGLGYAIVHMLLFPSL